VSEQLLCLAASFQIPFVCLLRSRLFRVWHKYEPRGGFSDDGFVFVASKAVNCQSTSCVPGQFLHHGSVSVASKDV
jgi:hypothetical protein